MACESCARGETVAQPDTLIRPEDNFLSLPQATLAAQQLDVRMGSERLSQRLSASPAKKVPGMPHDNAAAGSVAPSMRPASAQSLCEPFSGMDARFSSLIVGASLPRGVTPYVPSPLSTGQRTPQSVRCIAEPPR